MASRTMQEGYFEQEAETLQDSMADKKDKIVFFKKVNFQNVDKARKLLTKLKEDLMQYEELVGELQESIQVYEDVTEEDTRMAME